MPAPLAREESVLRSSGTFRWIVICILILSALWLASPMLTSTHVEAFSARLQSQAILDLQQKLALDDQVYPINTGYLYATRPGVVHALEWVMRLVGKGDGSFRIVIVTSYMLFVASCLMFVRRWSESPMWAALIFLFLTPGLVEISFFFADNLPSAALACFALALIHRNTSTAIWVLIGALLAGAVFMRLDALFMVPSVLVVSFMQAGPRLRRLATSWIMMAVGAAFIFLMTWKVTHLSLWQSLEMGRWFGTIHLHQTSGRRIAFDVIFGFFGLPSLVLLVFGSRRNLHQHTLAWKLCFALYPLLLYVFFLTKAVELRDFLLLGAPFLCLQGASGVSYVLSAIRSASSGRRRGVQAILAVCLLTILMPPATRMKDGPRTFTGRIWSPTLWRTWQSSIKGGLLKCDELIESAKPGDRILVVSTMYNSDRYLHLRLLQHGYTIHPGTSSTPYGEMAEVYTRNDITFVHLRTEVPYQIPTRPPASLPYKYVQDYQLYAGLNAVSSFDPNRAFLLTWGGSEEYQDFIARTAQFQKEAGMMDQYFPTIHFIPTLESAFYGELRVIPLTPDDVGELRNFSEGEVQAMEKTAQSKWHPIRKYQDFHELVLSRYWTP